MHMLQFLELNDPCLPISLPNGVLVELAMLTLEGGKQPDFKAIAQWFRKQRRLPGVQLPGKLVDAGLAVKNVWEKYRRVNKDNCVVQTMQVLNRQYKLVSTGNKPTDSSHTHSTLSTQLDFDPACSQRALRKLALQLSRSQVEAAAQAQVLQRTQQRLQESEENNLAQQLTIEKLKAHICRLKLQAIGSPKVREALEHAAVADDRALEANSRLKALEQQLRDAVLENKKMQHAHYLQCKVN